MLENVSERKQSDQRRRPNSVSFVCRRLTVKEEPMRLQRSERKGFRLSRLLPVKEEPMRLQRSESKGFELSK